MGFVPWPLTTIVARSKDSLYSLFTTSREDQGYFDRVLPDYGLCRALRVVPARGCLSARARRWPNMPTHHYHPVSMVPIASKRRDIPFAHNVNADICVVVTAF
jgi:hypothetical protein